MPEIVSLTSKRSSDDRRREPATYDPRQADPRARREKSSSRPAKNSWSGLPSYRSSRVHHGIAFKALLPFGVRMRGTATGDDSPGQHATFCWPQLSSLIMRLRRRLTRTLFFPNLTRKGVPPGSTYAGCASHRPSASCYRCHHLFGIGDARARTPSLTAPPSAGNSTFPSNIPGRWC